jgi:hypothetical protein
MLSVELDAAVDAPDGVWFAELVAESRATPSDDPRLEQLTVANVPAMMVATSEMTFIWTFSS